MAGSTERRRQAIQTRQRIRDAARDLFVADGYTAATITNIARRAAVAPQTVYFTYRSKAGLLSAVIDAEIVGDHAQVPLLDRPAATRVAALTDPAQRLRSAVSLLCDVTERVAPVYELARGGSSDPEVRALLDRHEQQRRQTHRVLVGLLADNLRTGLGLEEASDRLYALVSHEMYWLLVERCGWTKARWRRLAQEEAHRQLLPAD
ncbi:MAG: TetR/AcrR family transcriptional regulator [Actinomycetota bacterium]|nr:TetR/AcrR family transcriptional regulator [Actinomycetota bacterium]